jgi:Fe-S-cluster containining protein
VKPLPVLPDQVRQRLFKTAEQWFDRGRAAVLDAIPCRRGCTRCCIGPFAITILDQQEMHQGLADLSAPQRNEIGTRASTQIARMEQAFPQLATSPYLDDWPSSDLDALVAAFADLPCPALGEDGSCLVYAHRPLTCRMMGLPTEMEGLTFGACEIQTSVPVVRMPAMFQDDEDRIAGEEAMLIEQEQERTKQAGEEILLTYGFARDVSRTA